MRVIYFSQNYTPHDWRHLTKLAQSGYQVWFLRLWGASGELEKRPLPEAIKLVPPLYGNRQPVNAIEYLTCVVRLRKLISKVRPQLLHAGPVGSCGLIAALSRFRPLVVMSWGSDVLLEADRTRWSRRISRFTLRQAQGIIGDCSAVREKIKLISSVPDQRIATYPWGVDLRMFRPVPPSLPLRQDLGWQNKLVLLSTRSWEPIYGIDTLLQGFAEATRLCPEIRLLLAGDGSLSEFVHAFIDKHHLSDFVHLVGRIPNEHLPEYYNSADLYVSTSHSDGSSVSLLEAMACGLPVIVSDIAGNREWVQQGENGWLFPPGGASSLAASIFAAANSNVRQALGQRNRNVALERADWERNVGVLLDTYERLMA